VPVLRAEPGRTAEDVITDLAARAPGLTLLVLHGSRARGDARADSDWDLAYLGEGRFDPDALLAELVLALGTESVDLSRLEPSGGLFRYRVARDGRALFEAEEGLFARFWFDAVSFWCDAQPVLQEGYESILREYR
jgi:predicted nucleotidyltransferase